jgi:hypothetical protein
MASGHRRMELRRSNREITAAPLHSGVRSWPDRRPTTERLRARGFPHRCIPSLTWPTYRENSHANHTRDSPSRKTTCFPAPESSPVWDRFPSPDPLLQVRESEDLRRRCAHIAQSQCPIGARLRARSARNTLETNTARNGGLLLPVIDLYQSRTGDRVWPCSGESVNRRALLLRTQSLAIEPSRGSSGSATDSSSTS